jgi:FMN phosphatase YigB (HAD superfamily)
VGVISGLRTRINRRIEINRKIKIIRASGLFDSDWYLKANPDVKYARIDPIRHYLTSGALEGRNPSQSFDTSYYYSSYPEVRVANVNPLLHYIEHGQAEGRTVLPDRKPEPLRDDGSILKWHRDAPPPVDRQAMVLHVYYPDLAEDLLSLSNFLPPESKVLVNACTPEAREAVEGWAVKNNRAVIIKTGQNRGRNVVSYTVRFGRYLLENIDVFCHLHTKKTPFWPEGGDRWRRHNTGHLCGSPAVYREIANAFGDMSLGAISPPPFDELVYWTSCWLTNRPQASRLSEILEIDVPGDGYTDYPVGNMFWARPNALWQLLDGRIKEDDFFEEKGQLDGGLHHGIERVIFTLAKANGYDWAEFNADQMSFSRGRCGKNLRQYRELASYTRLKDMIANSKVISFSLFDTLLCSKLLRHEMLYDVLEHKLVERYGSEFVDFPEKRIAAESRVREEKGPSANIVDVYRHLDYTPDTSELVEMEFLEELAFSVPRGRMVDAIRYARSLGKSTILTCDTYWRRSEVKRFLRHHGIELPDKIYLSNEVNLCKGDVSLWKFLFQEEGIDYHGFMHVGDDEVTDALSLTDRAVSFHILGPRHLLHFSEVGRELAARPSTAKSEWSKGLIAARLFADPFTD